MNENSQGRRQCCVQKIKVHKTSSQKESTKCQRGEKEDYESLAL